MNRFLSRGNTFKYPKKRALRTSLRTFVYFQLLTLRARNWEALKIRNERNRKKVGLSNSFRGTRYFRILAGRKNKGKYFMWRKSNDHGLPLLQMSSRELSYLCIKQARKISQQTAKKKNPAKQANSCMGRLGGNSIGPKQLCSFEKFLPSRTSDLFYFALFWFPRFWATMLHKMWLEWQKVKKLLCSAQKDFQWGVPGPPTPITHFSFI